MREDYSSLFESEVEEEDIRGETDEEKKKRLEEEESENKRQRKWNWFTLVYILSKGEVTKRNEVLRMNYISALNWLLFEKENKHIKEKYD